MEQRKENHQHESMNEVLANEIKSAVADIEKRHVELPEAQWRQATSKDLREFTAQLREHRFPGSHLVAIEGEAIYGYFEDDKGRSGLRKHTGEACGELGEIRLFDYPYIGTPMVVLNPDPSRAYDPLKLSEELKRNHSLELIPVEAVRGIQPYQSMQEETSKEFNELIKQFGEGGSTNFTATI